MLRIVVLRSWDAAPHRPPCPARLAPPALSRPRPSGRKEAQSAPDIAPVSRENAPFRGGCRLDPWGSDSPSGSRSRRPARRIQASMPDALNQRPKSDLRGAYSRWPERARGQAVWPSPLRLIGSPGRIRTSDQSVNSRPLYQLSYRGSGYRPFNPRQRPEVMVGTLEGQG